MLYYLHLVVYSLLFVITACGGTSSQNRVQMNQKKAPPPSWVQHVEVKADKLCGVGVAGAAFDENSPYPKQMSQERAAKNLAGVIETNIQEAIVDRATHRGATVDVAQIVLINDDLIQQVLANSKTEYWLDVAGFGPFAQKDFTYAHTCIDAKVAASQFKVDTHMIRGRSKKQSISPKHIPQWISRYGKQPGGRLCAVGFSLPTFHAEKTFDVVVEDIRIQLSTVLRTLVSEYYEELTTESYHVFEMMTVATTQAVSKGAVVTDFWYDRDGIGPNKKKRTTYGWGCVYPVDVMKKSVQKVENELPKNVIAKVRERAQNAFDELDAEIDKRDSLEQTKKQPSNTMPTAGTTQEVKSNSNDKTPFEVEASAPDKNTLNKNNRTEKTEIDSPLATETTIDNQEESGAPNSDPSKNQSSGSFPKTSVPNPTTSDL